MKYLGAPVIIKLGHTGCGGAQKLMELCRDGASETLRTLDPTLQWLQEALPLAKNVILKNAHLSESEKVYLLEEELVRDGVKKLQNFVDVMISNGCLAESQRPVIVGLLFNMHKAELHHLLDSGEFKLLSQTKADLLQHELQPNK